MGSQVGGTERHSLYGRKGEYKNAIMGKATGKSTLLNILAMLTSQLRAVFLNELTRKKIIKTARLPASAERN